MNTQKPYSELFRFIEDALNQAEGYVGLAPSETEYEDAVLDKTDAAITALRSLEEQFESLQREYRDYYEMTRSLVAQLEQMEVEREELENLVSQLLRDSNTVGGGQIGC